MTLTVDQMLEHVGTMGRFQWTVVVMCGTILIPVTFQTLIMTFMALEPPWKCVNGSELCNFTQLFEPTGDNPNKNFRCGIDRNEWEFTKPYTSIVTEWDLICDADWMASFSNAMTFVGWFFGNIVFGILSDKFGRRKVLFGSASLVCWMSFISSFLPKFWLFVIFRFFIGFGLGGAIVCLFIMATEFVGPDRRAMAGTFTWYFWTGALMVIALLAYLIRDWRHLSITVSAPGLLILIFWKCIPESVRWQLTHGRVKEAEDSLTRVAKFNKKAMPSQHLGLPEEKRPTKDATFLDLFRSRSMTKKTLISWFSWFVNAQVYFGVSLGSVLLGGNIYLNFFLTSLVELPGNAFAIWSMDRFGRKKVVVVGLFVGAIGNMLVTVVPTDPDNTGFTAARIIFALIGKFAIMCSFDAIFVYSAELFPTVVRNVGMGTSSAAGRIGAITSPYVIYLSRINKTLPYVVFAIDAFVAGVLCLLLPETNKEPTAETMADEERGAGHEVGKALLYEKETDAVTVPENGNKNKIKPGVEAKEDLIS